MLVGKDQEEEAGVFWALLKGRWRPSVEEDAAGMSARTEIKVNGIARAALTYINYHV